GSKSLKRWFLSYIILAILSLVIGVGIFVTLVGRPQIAVINVAYVELDGFTADEINKTLQFVRDDNSIKAVVIKLNSPGGTVSASANVFLNTVKIRDKKPVVVQVGDIAASGGYMWLLGANYVYAYPASMVGNVGAIMNLPAGASSPSENVVPTGPFKLTGGSYRTYIGWLESIKDEFIQTVFSQRGDRLKITPEELAGGKIYFGSDAARLGLIDALGTEVDAINKAAQLAGIRNYTLVDVNAALKEQGTNLSFSKFGNYSSNSVKEQFPYIHYMFWEPK
ncbi:MAG: S49 family peptidase, partial [Dehalococcoidia bacterium]|nr:S49 family peptidase [Dehalococcoidia bacterium]